MQKLLNIAGPTATGKTALAIGLARKYNGEIISADSRQVYKGMDIGTGKDLSKGSVYQTFEVMQIQDPGTDMGYYLIKRIPVWLIDIVKPDYHFHLSLYRRLALKAIDDISSRGKLPIVVGGTGLYIKSLLISMPEADILPDQKLRQQLEDKNAIELSEILKKKDPEKWQSMNQSDRKNPRRLIRAIEIAGRKYKEVFQPSQFDFLFVYLTAPKYYLMENIAERVKARIAAGVFEETEKLLKSGYDFNLLSFSASPYRQFKEYFESGKLPEMKTKAVGRWLKAEVDYAARQLVWFNKMAKELADKGRVITVDITKNFQSGLEQAIDKWYTERHAEEN